MKQWKLLPVLFLLMLLACTVSRTRVVYEPKSESITILHTNDMHANFLPSVVRGEGTPIANKKIGGFLALDSYIRKIRSSESNVLLLDAGDFMTGNPICDMEVDGALGGALVKFMNQMGYDGLTLGNHEFDISVENTRRLMALAQFPIFSSNLFTADGKLFTSEAYQIYSKGNLTIGVIGVVVPDLPNYLNKPQRDEVYDKPARPIIDSLAKIIDPITDLIIVLSHQGLEADRQLAQELGRQVDVIIGGHSHSRLEKPERVNGKIIVQTGSYCRNLGRLNLVVAADTVQSYQYELIALWNEGIEPDSSLARQVSYYEQQINEEYGRVIGELKTPWFRAKSGESNLGNFIADCIREFSEADFALINSGGIRQDLPAGPIKKLDIKNILPFNNLITKFIVSGDELLKLIEHNALAQSSGTEGILQISGLTYEWRMKADSSVVILKAQIGNEPIVPQKTYTGATVDFVVGNADKYFGFVPQVVTNLMMPLTDVVMKAVEKKQIIASAIEGRIIKRD
ncbi:MAG: bifunctional metallophosphatase/5'-nucleotidase [candidate division KSB1 bacterium]|nr:bifunctional metallophosphatase/5'-nucleotidase [candidate division KSB1 bacterium]